MHRWSRTLAGALGVLALAVAACGGSDGSKSSSSNASASSRPTFGKCHMSGPFGVDKLKTVTPDTLTIKADLPSPGWWNGDTVDQIDSGYEYCLAATIAYRAGLHHLKLQNVSFDALVAGKTGDFDLSFDEISITPERQKVVSFSDPYFDSNIGVLVKKGAGVTAANLRGKKLGIKQGTAGAQFVHDVLKPTQAPSVFPGDPEMLAAVQSGRVDAGLTDVAILLGEANKSGGRLQVAGQYKTNESYGALFPKGSPNIATVNKILAEAKQDGTLADYSKTYLAEAFGGDPNAVPVWSVQ